MLDRLRGLDRQQILLSLLGIAATVGFAYHLGVATLLPDVGPRTVMWVTTFGLVVLGGRGIWMGLGLTPRWGLVLWVGFGVALLLVPSPFLIQGVERVASLRTLYRPARYAAQGLVKQDPPTDVRRRLEQLVREKVPKGATVMVPMRWAEFRIRAERSPFVTWEDMIPAEFSREFAMEWLRRYKVQMGTNDVWAPSESGEKTTSLPESGLIALASAPDGPAYVICREPLAFPVVEEVSLWRLYRIGTQESAGSPMRPGQTK